MRPRAVPVLFTTQAEMATVVLCCAVQVAKIIREDFLAQNAYSPYDPCCPFYKSVWMLKNIILFYTLAIKSVELSGNDRKITLNAIKNVRPRPRPTAACSWLHTKCCWTLSRLSRKKELRGDVA